MATPALRRYDSASDIIYYLFILGTAWILCRPVLKQRTWPWVAAILGSEALAIAVGFLKFGKYPAAHSWLAKLFGLCLLGRAGCLAGLCRRRLVSDDHGRGGAGVEHRKPSAFTCWQPSRPWM